MFAMRGQLPGQDVRAIREALGLTAIQFATVLGVHPSSVHRWESAAQRPVEIEGVAWNVLTALRQRVLAEKLSKQKAAEQGQRISNELAMSGALAALALLLLFAAGREK